MHHAPWVHLVSNTTHIGGGLAAYIANVVLGPIFWMNTFLAVIKYCLKDKLLFAGGRATRTEFWLFTLFAILVRLILFPLNLIEAGAMVFGMIYAVINFLVFVAHYTVLVRRLHDTNRSAMHFAPFFVGMLLILAGFFLALPLAITVGEILSCVGIVYALVLCALPGNKDSNDYGAPVPVPSLK